MASMLGSPLSGNVNSGRPKRGIGKTKRNIVFDTLLFLKQSYHKKIIKKHIDYFLTPSDNLTQFVKTHFQKQNVKIRSCIHCIL